MLKLFLFQAFLKYVELLIVSWFNS